MSRKVFLVVKHAGAIESPAHWCLWIPSADNESIGKVIHVVGSPMRGYIHEFKCRYDPSKSSTLKTMVNLGQVDNKHVSDVSAYDGMSSASEPTTYQDDLEKVALRVAAPGRLRGYNPLTPPTPGDGDCQFWIERYINALVAEEILDSSVLALLESAPRRVVKRQ